MPCCLARALVMLPISFTASSSQPPKTSTGRGTKKTASCSHSIWYLRFFSRLANSSACLGFSTTLLTRSFLKLLIQSYFWKCPKRCLTKGGSNLSPLKFDFKKMKFGMGHIFRKIIDWSIAQMSKKFWKKSKIKFFNPQGDKFWQDESYDNYQNLIKGELLLHYGLLMLTKKSTLAMGKGLGDHIVRPEKEKKVTPLVSIE